MGPTLAPPRPFPLLSLLFPCLLFSLFFFHFTLIPWFSAVVFSLPSHPTPILTTSDARLVLYPLAPHPWPPAFRAPLSPFFRLRRRRRSSPLPPLLCRLNQMVSAQEPHFLSLFASGLLCFVRDVDIDACTGSVSTVTIPLIVTSIVTIVDPTSTLFASCPSTSTPISTIPSSLSQSTTPQPSQSPSFAPTTIVITTTPSPTVITTTQASTLGNGAITVITITTTSTPSPDVIVYSTSVPAAPSQSSKSSNIVPIAAGAVGGFIILIGAVAALWFILCVRVFGSQAKLLTWILSSKRCRKPNARANDEDEVVFPYPVIRDQQRVDLSRGYEYGHVGRPTSTIGPGGSPGMVNHSYTGDGRRDSATALIGPGLTPMASNSGTLASIPGIQQVRGGDVGRQSSRGSAHQLPPGAAPPTDHSVTGRSSVSGSSTTSPGPSNRRPLQVMNTSLSPIQSSFSPGDMPNSGFGPMAAPESAWPEKQDVPSSSSGPPMVHSDGGHIQSSGHRPSVSGSGSVLLPERKPSTQPEPSSSNVEPNEPPPAYVA